MMADLFSMPEHLVEKSGELTSMVERVLWLAYIIFCAKYR
jgi:hypothetical protein